MKIFSTIFALIISSIHVFAQIETKKSIIEKTEQQKDSVYYTCPMHPDVKLSGVGKCPECEMDLEQKTIKTCDVKPQKVVIPKIYICPVHPTMQSDKPGKCPKCGADLVEKKKK